MGMSSDITFRKQDFEHPHSRVPFFVTRTPSARIKCYNPSMALDTLTLEQLQETRQSTKNQLARVSGIQAEAVKDTLAAVEDMIRIRQDERRLQRLKV
jgi:hypothetical protein